MKGVATKSKNIAVLAGLAVFTLAATGCAQEKPEVQEIDLTQSENLFSQPLQPNPLSFNANDVVVTVNGKEILHGEIMQGVQMNMMQLSRQVPPQQLQQLAGQIYQNVLDRLIANILLSDAAAASGLTVSDEEINAEIAEIKANAPEGVTLEEALAENNITMEEWVDSLREQMLVRKLVEAHTDHVNVLSPAEVERFYQENIEAFQVPENVTASHILIAFSDEDTEASKAEKKQKLLELREQIVAGTPFETVAEANSDCPSRQQGGSLGAFTRGQMVPEFENAAFSATPGEVTDVVESPFGYHLILVSEHEQESTRPLAEVREQLEAYLLSQRKQEALVDYVNKLREKADIQHQKPNLDSDG